jgi:hypothetical protein
MTATPASTARVRPANSPSRLMGDGPRLRGGVVSRSDAWVVAFPGTGVAPLLATFTPCQSSVESRSTEPVGDCGRRRPRSPALSGSG